MFNCVSLFDGGVVEWFLGMVLQGSSLVLKISWAFAVFLVLVGSAGKIFVKVAVFCSTFELV